MPGVRSLDDPAPRFASNASNERRLSAAADMGRDAACSDGGLDIRVVVAFVEAQVLRAPWTARAAQHHRVKRLSHEPLVMHICAGDLARQRNAATVGKDVALDAALGAIRWIRTGQVPPLGALTIALSSDPHFHWIPRRLS